MLNWNRRLPEVQTVRASTGSRSDAAFDSFDTRVWEILQHSYDIKTEKPS